MATILETLNQGYPVPMATLERVALVRGVELMTEATTEVLISKVYRLATADIMRWMSTASNVSQAGIAFDLLVSTREDLRKQSNAVYKEYGDAMYEPENSTAVTFGYKGKKL